MRNQSPSSNGASSDLHLPRILCLHGGGSNADVFRVQCRVLRSHLKNAFRFCFVDGPSYSPGALGVSSVYADYEPFRCWVKWVPGDCGEVPGPRTLNNIENTLREAMAEDNRKGATGKWVGIMGFSQGGRITTSVLMKQQAQTEQDVQELDSFGFRFGILMNSRGPVLPFGLKSTEGGGGAVEEFPVDSYRVNIPTIHVHGRRDPGLLSHRNLRDDSYLKSSTRLVEWDGDHRIPIKQADVDSVATQILEVAKQTGAI